MRRRLFTSGLFLAPFVSGLRPATAEGSAEPIGLARRVSDFTLSNGLRVIVAERRSVPLASFSMAVPAGWADEPPGKAGIGRMFERLWVKGSADLGSRNAALEKKTLTEVEAHYTPLQSSAGEQSASALQDAQFRQVNFKMAMERARALAWPDWYRTVVEGNGGSSLGAVVEPDYTHIHFTLPSNRAELFFLIQSSWLRNPSFRDFYYEREALRAEQNVRWNQRRELQLQESMLGKALGDHPYRLLRAPEEQLRELRTADAEAFFRAWYSPPNITIAIAGDITASQARTLAERYFGPIPARPVPERRAPDQRRNDGAERTRLRLQTEPLVALAWPAPPVASPDWTLLHLLVALFTGGPRSYAHRSLVRDSRMVRRLAAVAAYPGQRHPSLVYVSAIPALGRGHQEVEDAIRGIADELASRPLGEEDVEQARTLARASLLARIEDNPGLAGRLAIAQALRGAWNAVFADLERLREAGPADVQRIASQCFGAGPVAAGWIGP